MSEVHVPPTLIGYCNNVGVLLPGEVGEKLTQYRGGETRSVPGQGPTMLWRGAPLGLQSNKAFTQCLISPLSISPDFHCCEVTNLNLLTSPMNLLFLPFTYFVTHPLLILLSPGKALINVDN